MESLPSAPLEGVLGRNKIQLWAFHTAIGYIINAVDSAKHPIHFICSFIHIFFENLTDMLTVRSYSYRIGLRGVPSWSADINTTPVLSPATQFTSPMWCDATIIIEIHSKLIASLSIGGPRTGRSLNCVSVRGELFPLACWIWYSFKCNLKVIQTIYEPQFHKGILYVFW